MIGFPSCSIFPQYTVCESRKIIAWPKGEKIKTQGGKISYIFQQLDFFALFTVTIKIIWEKYDNMSPVACIFFPNFPLCYEILYDLISLLPYFPPCSADFSLLNFAKGKSLGRSKPATSSYAQAPQHTVWETSTISKPY
jgi:hypothetical protein